ncbi:hypothetical protein evm_015282 [Chilo suppressalis]|nr:hypothetical protein evm_015282 [Chilo suppressalis]
MPKRSAEQKIERYNRKIRKLQLESEEKKKKKRHRIIISDDEFDLNHEQNYTNYNQEQNQPEEIPLAQCESSPSIDEKVAEDTQAEHVLPSEPNLDPELLLALGEAVSDTPDFGEKILDSQAKLWIPILKKRCPKGT